MLPEFKHLNTLTVQVKTEMTTMCLAGGSVHSMDTLDKGVIHVQGRIEQDGMSCPDTTKNGVQFNTHELFLKFAI